MKRNISIEEINLIKYAILALPPGKSTTYIYTNFETRSGPSLLPRTNNEAYIREINNVVARNIRKSLQSFQRHSSSKSTYTPLPQDYSPYDYIRPKFGSEHYLLPPFTFDIWISQFPQPTTEMPTTRKKKSVKSSTSPAVHATTPQRESSFAPKATKDVDNEIVVSPRIPDFCRPKIISTNTQVLKQPCDIHIHMTFDKNGLAVAGDLFGLYAMLVNNGAEKDGVKVDVMVLCHVRPTPLDSALPFEHVPYIGDDKKTIFMRMASGIDPKFIGEMKVKTVSHLKKALGTDSPQVETYFDAMETKIAECPVSHSIVAITFNGCPPFVSNKDALIQFQSNDAIASHKEGLTAIFTLMGYKFKEEVLKLHTTYNLIGYTYILLLDTNPLKVKEQNKKSSKSHFSLMVENARKQCKMEYGSEDDVDGLNGRFDGISIGESTESESSSTTSTSDHDRRHSTTTNSKSRDRRSSSSYHHRHRNSVSKSGTHQRSASKSGGHHPKSAPKSDEDCRRSASKSGYHRHSASKSNDRRRKSASKSDDHHRHSSSMRGNGHNYYESDEDSLSKKYHGGSSSHRTKSKSDNHGRRGTSHGRGSTSKSSNRHHQAASSGRRDHYLYSETGSNQRRNKSRRRHSGTDPDGSKSYGTSRQHGSMRSDQHRRSESDHDEFIVGSCQSGSMGSDQRRRYASKKSDPDGSKSSGSSQSGSMGSDQRRRSASKDGTNSHHSHGSDSVEARASASRNHIRNSGASTSSPTHSFNSPNAGNCIDDRKSDIPQNINVDDLYVSDSSNNQQPSTPGTKGSLIEQIGTRSSHFFSQVFGTPDVPEFSNKKEGSGGSPSDFSRVTERAKSKKEAEQKHSRSNSYKLRSKNATTK